MLLAPAVRLPRQHGCTHDTAYRSISRVSLDRESCWGTLEKKKSSSILSVIAATILGLLAFGFTSNTIEKLLTNRGVSIENALVKASETMNKTAPVMVDADTRWDGTTPGPGKLLLYRFTLVKLTKEDERDLEKYVATMRPMLVNTYKTNPDMKGFQVGGVTLRDNYSYKDGTPVTEISVGREDLK